MEKNVLNITNYTFSLIENHYRSALVHFKNKEEGKEIHLSFESGTDSTNFLLESLGQIDYWDVADKRWKGRKIGIATIDEKVVALINPHTDAFFLLQTEEKKIAKPILKKMIHQTLQKNAG